MTVVRKKTKVLVASYFRVMMTRLDDTNKVNPFWVRTFTAWTLTGWPNGVKLPNSTGIRMLSRRYDTNADVWMRYWRCCGGLLAPVLLGKKKKKKKNDLNDKFILKRIKLGPTASRPSWRSSAGWYSINIHVPDFFSNNLSKWQKKPESYSKSNFRK